MKKRIIKLCMVFLVFFIIGCSNPVTPTTDPVTPTTDPVTPTTDPVTPTTDPVTPTTDLLASTIVFSDGLNVFKVLDTSTYTNTVSGVGDGSISYTSGDPSVATVDANTGKVTLMSAGTSIITANKAATATHSAITANYSIIVIKPCLPLLVIATNNNIPISNKDDWIKGNISISDSGTITDLGNLEIKGRGNSTWGMPKKPYSLKLDNKKSILGMKSNKRWVLLANYSDKTLLRSTFAFDLGLSVYNNLKWTPDSKMVEVVLNNEYIGVYQIVEQIRIDKNRVDLNLDNGEFLMEVNARLDEKANFTTTRGVPFSFNEPEDPDVSTFNEINGKLQEVEDVIYSETFSDETNGYVKYIDVDSFVDWYIINEFTKNNDAIFYSSVYLFYKDSKIFMGPIWDFDISSGNINYNGCDDPENYWIKDAKWISRLLEDASFVEKVKTRWNEKKDELQSKINDISIKASQLNLAASNNFQRWDILSTYVWPNRIITGSYNGEVSACIEWLNKRYTWMDCEINK